MKSALKTLAVLLFAVMPVVAFAQDNQEKQTKKKLFRPTYEIASVEKEDEGTAYTVFSLPDNGQEHYFLSLGSLGIGGEIIQIDIDPVFELFIPLGDTLEEVQARLEELAALAKEPIGTSIEIKGCLATGYPTTEDLEPVTVKTFKFILGRQIRFSVPRGDILRATFVAKSDLKALLSSVKFYRKLHPKQQ